MKKITFLLALCVTASFGIMNAQVLENTLGYSPLGENITQQTSQLPAAYYRFITAPVRETTHAVEDSEISIDLHNIQILSTSSFSATARPNQTFGFEENLIYTSGPFSNSSNLSIMETVAEGMTLLGFGAQKSSDNSVAEQFTLPLNFDITSIDVYAYQTNTAPPSITAVYMQVWDGDPSSGNASVVWGDLLTNILEDVEDTGVYRVEDDDQGNTDRKIQKVTANTSGLSLNTGSYWVEYTFEGSGSSGPWVPPVVVLGETITGNALQNVTGTWQALVDGPNDDPQGLPIQIYGIADIGNNSCVEMNPPYDWYFEDGVPIDSGTGILAANDLTLEANESFTLQNITAFMASDWPITSVDVTYYDDDNGLPGSIIGSEDAVTINDVSAIGIATGETFNIYEVKMTVDPFEFSGQTNNATTYWIQLTVTNSSNTIVFWVGTSENMVGNPMVQYGGNGWGNYSSDFDGLYIWGGECTPLLSVEDNELVQFRVYPNPANDVLYLEASNNIESISLMNLLGQKVLTGEIDNSSTQISLAGLQAGTYILKTTIDGQVQTQKIIKN